MMDKLTDAQLLALVVYGEARGEPMEGKVAVAWVIVNRRNKGGWFGKDLRSVILKPKQFSCFNLSDPNRIKLMGIAGDWEGKFDYDKALRDCFYVAEGVLNGQFVDPTNGATHYEVKGTGAYWAKTMVQVEEIGHHVFYKEKA